MFYNPTNSAITLRVSQITIHSGIYLTMLHFFITHTYSSCKNFSISNTRSCQSDSGALHFVCSNTSHTNKEWLSFILVEYNDIACTTKSFRSEFCFVSLILSVPKLGEWLDKTMRFLILLLVCNSTEKWLYSLTPHWAYFLTAFEMLINSIHTLVYRMIYMYSFIERMKCAFICQVTD